MTLNSGAETFNFQKLIAEYLRFLWRSGNEHAIHSPFLFDLYTQVISKKKEKHHDFLKLELLRKKLRADNREIEVLDLGAGSRINKSNRRKIRAIAKNAEKPARFGKLFYRLIRRFQPGTIVELGTSLGLTTLYLAKAKPDAKVITFEGCPQTAAVAKQNFDAHGVSNIRVITGNIDETLQPALEGIKSIDFLYIDANHRYEPTVRYFTDCLPYAHNESIFIFDDIYWSEGMTQAWNEIKAHPQVTLAVDLFWIGLVFFRKEQAKEEFTLRF